ncbi:FAD binding domain-containing protein [Aquicoccus sp.]|uniref:FAD binding domain-containing protein n=1 Tax=Aquicoccus sp. TaxID=2055851 RepID=UPI00356405A4
MRFETPTSVDQAVALLAADPGARLLAGGTDLLVRLRAGNIAPSTIIDIKRIAEMTVISQEDGGWRIGAAVPSAEMNEHAALKADWPGVVESADLIGSTQIQGRATLAGNLCNASPAADSVPAMVAAGATARIAGPDGTRDVAVEDIPTGVGKTSLSKGELVTSIHLPPKPARSGDAYLRFIPRTEMDIAVVGCGIYVTLDDQGKISDARVALGAVAPTVILSQSCADTLIGTAGDDAALDALAAAASAEAKPIDDKRGTVAFRKDVAGVLAKRAAKIALARARGDS